MSYLLAPALPAPFVELYASGVFAVFWVLLCLVTALVGVWARQPRRLGGLFTSLGIAGTFVGILLALLPFVTNSGRSIQEHIPEILQGVGLAMVTSVIGIGLALLVRVSVASRSRETDVGRLLLDAIDRQQEAIEKQTIIVQGQLQQQTGLVAHLVDAEGRRKEATASHRELVASHLTRQREHEERVEEHHARLEVGQAELKGLLDDALEELTERSTEAIVEALQEIVEGYNEHIQRQLGESFDALREAADQLSTWQRVHLEEVRAAHYALDLTRALIDHLEEASKRHSDLTERSEAVLARLQGGLEAATEVSEALIEHLPGLSEQAEGVIGAVAERFAEQSHAIQREVDATANRLGETVGQVADQFAQTADAHSARLSSAVTEAGDRLKEESGEAARLLTEAIEGLNAIPDQHRRRIEELLESYGSGLDAAAERALASVGDRLANVVTQQTARLEPAQEELLSAFEQLHLLIGDFRRGIDGYQRSVDEGATAVSAATQRLHTGLERSTQEHLQRIAQALAGIHGYYHDRFLKIEGDFRDYLDVATAPTNGSPHGRHSAA